jgi:hypothetical protein
MPTIQGNIKGQKGDTGLIPNFSVSALKSTTNKGNLVFVSDAGKEGIFKLDSTDTTTADNVGTVLVDNDGKRFKRAIPSSTNISLLNFGAVGDGVTDCTNAILLAVNYQSITGQIIDIPKGTYKISSTITKPQSFNGLSLNAIGNVIFDYSSIASNLPCLNIIGGSGFLCKNVVSGISFKGNSTSIAIQIDGQCGQKIERCIFDNNSIGVKFFNNTSGNFSEWNTISDCTFNSTCTTAVRYSKNLGTQSFHGSGLIGYNFINTSNSDCIVIDNGCLPYNCPMNVQVWINSTVNFIQNNNTTYTPYFTGNITFERFTGSMVIGIGNSMYFVGGITVLGDYVESGSLFQCKGVVANQNNSTLPVGLRSNIQKKIVSTSTVISNLVGSIFKVVGQIQGPNYEFSFSIIVDSTGNFLNNISTPIFLRQFNSAGYGMPIFSIDSSGKLIVSNVNYPVSGANQLTLNCTYRQIGDFTYGNSNAKVI